FLASTSSIHFCSARSAVSLPAASAPCTEVMMASSLLSRTSAISASACWPSALRGSSLIGGSSSLPDTTVHRADSSDACHHPIDLIGRNIDAEHDRHE